MVRAEFSNATDYEIVVREGTEGAYKFYTKIASHGNHTVNYGGSESKTYREFLCVLESNNRQIGETIITTLDIVDNEEFKFEFENGKFGVSKTPRTAKGTGGAVTDENITKAVKDSMQWIGRQMGGKKKSPTPEGSGYSAPISATASPALSRSGSESSALAATDSSSARGPAPKTAQPSVTSKRL